MCLRSSQAKNDHYGSLPQLIFLDAKGKLTVREYVEYMAQQYSKVPENLDDTIIQELNSLITEKIIVYSDVEITLESKFEQPISKQL